VYFNTPKLIHYTHFIVKYRLLVLLSTFLLALVTFLSFNFAYVTSDEHFWLSDSKELQKTKEIGQSTQYITKLTLKMSDTLYAKGELQKLQDFYINLQGYEGINRIHSIFSEKHYSKSGTNDSSLLKIEALTDVPSQVLKERIDHFYPLYQSVINPYGSELYFYIHSEKPIEIERDLIPYEYEIYAPKESEKEGYLGISLLILIIFFMIMQITFRSMIGSFAGLFVVLLTVLFTSAIVQIFFPNADMHIAMVFIVVSIAILDYLYIYYRWHSAQIKHTKIASLVRALDRNLKPALWTTLTTIIGLGSLLLVDSEIVQLLSLNAILASFIAYILNFTFLPAWLSFFEIRDPKLNFANLTFAFANRELHYKKAHLIFFLSASIIAGLFTFSVFVAKPTSFINDSKPTSRLTLALPNSELTPELFNQMADYEEALQKAFNHELNIESIHKTIQLLHKLESDIPLTDESLNRYLFFLDIYEFNTHLYDDNNLYFSITFDKDKIKHNEVTQWIRHYDSDLKPVFTDIDSLINSAKYDNALILGISLFFALALIGVLMGIVISDIAMVGVAFMTNAVPIIWFALMMYLLAIPLTLEILIAMTIAVGLASDATIHFVYKYNVSRYREKSKKEALELVFFYSGVPVVVGSIFLAMTFFMFMLSDIKALQQIGFYEGVLILISLLTDLFILPVLLLLTDHFGRGRRDLKIFRS
jgi:predicted RND superfamily exporter protein